MCVRSDGCPHATDGAWVRMCAGSELDVEGSAKKKVKLINHMKAESLHGRLPDSVRLELLERITTPALETFAVLREHMRHRPFVCVAGGFGPMLSTVQDALLVRVMQHMRSASTSLRKVSRDLCNLHAWAAVHRLILTSFQLPPRLLAAGVDAEACDAFARLHARFPRLPIRCEIRDAEMLQRPVLRAIGGSSMLISVALYGARIGLGGARA